MADPAASTSPHRSVKITPEWVREHLGPTDAVPLAALAAIAANEFRAPWLTTEAAAAALAPLHLASPGHVSQSEAPAAFAELKQLVRKEKHERRTSKEQTRRLRASTSKDKLEALVHTHHRHSPSETPKAPQKIRTGDKSHSSDALPAPEPSPSPSSSTTPTAKVPAPPVLPQSSLSPADGGSPEMRSVGSANVGDSSDAGREAGAANDASSNSSAGISFFLQLSKMFSKTIGGQDASEQELDAFEARFDSAEVLGDSFCRVPAGAVAVRGFARATPGEQPALDALPLLEGSERVCTEMLLGPVQVVRQAHTAKREPRAITQPDVVDEYEPLDQRGAAGAEPPKTGDVDPLSPEWLKPVTAGTDAANARVRGEHRIVLPRYFRPDCEHDVLAFTEPPDYPLPYHSAKQRVLLEVAQIKFWLGDTEPFFTTVTLIDLATRTRVSEDWHMDCNKPEVRALLGRADIDTETTASKAIFNLPLCTRGGQGVWALIRVSKVYQGTPIEDMQDPYMKGESGASSRDTVRTFGNVAERFKKDVARYADKRQSFACAAFEVVGEDGVVKFGTQKGMFNRAIVKDMKDALEFVLDTREMLRKGKESKKQIPSQWQVHVFETSHVASNCINVDSMRRVTVPPASRTFHSMWEGECKLSKQRSMSIDGEPIYNAQELCPVPEPCQNSGYTNLLYVYPLEIQLPKEKEFKHVSLSVSAYLCEKESFVPDECIPCWFGPSHCKKYARSVSTVVVHDERQPTFFDELKAKMPLPVKQSHTIVFVARNTPTPDCDSTASWFAWMPLSAAVDAQEHTLALYPFAAPRNFAAVCPKDMSPAAESQKAVPFRVRVHIVSTVSPPDSNLRRFMHIMDSTDVGVEQVQSSLKMLKSVRPELLIQNFAPLMRCILGTFCLDMPPAGQFSLIKHFFGILSPIAPLLEGEGPRFPLLDQFVVYFFRNIKSTNPARYKYEVFEGLLGSLNTFLDFLAQKSQDIEDNTLESILSLCWFPFDIISKSLTLEVADKLDDPKRYQWLSADERWSVFGRSLLQVATNLGKFTRASLMKGKLVLETNAFFGMFIRDLFSIFHRGRAIEMARKYVDALTEKVAGEEKIVNTLLFLEFEFLGVLGDYQYFLEINVPLIPSIESTSTLCETLCKRHMLMGLISREVFKALTNPCSEVRIMALSVLSQIQLRNVTDERLITEEGKARFSHLFFPIILMMIDDCLSVNKWLELSKNNSIEQQALFVPVLYALKRVNRDFLVSWYSTEVISRLTILLNTMVSAIKSFEWNPEESATMPPSFSYLISQAHKRMLQEYLNTSTELAAISPAPSPGSPPPSEQGSRPGSFVVNTPDDPIRKIGARNRTSLSLTQLPAVKELPAKVNALRVLRGRDSISHAAAQGHKRLSEVVMTVIQNKIAQVERASQGHAVAAVEIFAKALATEANLVCLDVLEDLMKILHNELMSKDHLLMNKVFGVFKAFLSSRQSVRFLGHCLASVRSFVFKFRNALFLSQTPYCGELCTDLVRLCNFNTPSVRSQATATLYLMAKCNWRESGNIERVRLGVTVGLALLADRAPSTANFERALATISFYSKHDAELGGNAVGELSLFSLLAEESETVRREASVKRLELKNATDLANAELDSRLRAQQAWLDARTATADAIAAGPQATPAHVALLKLLAASLEAEREAFSTAAGDAGGADVPQETKEKASSLYRSFRDLRKRVDGLASDESHAQHKRERAEKSANAYADTARAAEEWVASLVPGVMCSQDCLGAVWADASAREERWAAAEREYQTRVAALKSSDANLELAATLSHSELDELFAAVRKVAAVHKAATCAAVEATAASAAAAARLRSACAGLSEFMDKELTSFGDLSKTDGILQRGNQLAEAVRVESRQRAVAETCGVVWDHVSPVVASARDFGELRRRLAAKRYRMADVLRQRQEAEAREVAVARECEALASWSLHAVLACGSSLENASAARLAAETEAHRKLEEEATGAMRERWAKLRSDMAGLAVEKTLGRPGFVGHAEGALAELWKLANAALAERRAALSSEASRAKLHADMRADLAGRVERLRERAASLGEASSDAVRKEEETLVNEMRQILSARAAMLSARVPEHSRGCKTSVSDLEALVRAALARMQKKSDAAAGAQPTLGREESQARLASPRGGAQFAEGLRSFTSNLTKINKDMQRLNAMAKEKAAPELLQELHFEIARSYADTPELHVVWMRRLSDMHRTQGNMLEAAMCLLIAAKVIHNAVAGSGHALNIGALEAILPALADVQLPQRQQQQQAAQSRELSEEALVTTIEEAVELFVKCEYFEFCTTAYNFVLPLLAARRENRRLAHVYQRMQYMFEQIAEKEKARMLGSFYRVAFRGPAFGTGETAAAAEYIYMLPAGVHLFEFSDTLKQRYAKDGASIVDSTKSLAELEAGKNWIQLTSVKPYLDEDEAATRGTFFQRNTVVGRFFLETPFTKEGAARSADASRQWKRKTILTAAGTFPAPMRRLRVVSRTVVEMSPIDNAIEAVRARRAAMLDEVASVRIASHMGPPPLGQLQLLLQGSVLLQVNGGILELCQSFVTDEGRREWGADVPRLLDAISEFTGTCRRALDANKEFIRQDQAAFHAELESGYAELERRVKAFSS
eukprot:m51a1_g7187 hypothetical protein (2626) ;mRNA; r:100574-110130